MKNNDNLSSEAQCVKTVDMIFPSGLVAKLEKLFSNEKIDFNKVLFTVYYINKGKWNGLKSKYEDYQEVSSRFPNWLSLPGKKGTDFLKRLVDGGIIRKQTGYVTAKHYTRYTLVERFDSKGKDARSDDYRLYSLKEDAGAFIRKYIADNFVVKIGSTTENKFVKFSNVEVVSSSELQKFNDLIIKMQMQIEEMQIEINKLKQDKQKQPNPILDEDFVQFEDIFIEEKIEEKKATVVEYATITKQRPKMDDYYLVVAAYHSKSNNYDVEGLLQYAKKFRALNTDTLIERLNEMVEYIDYLNKREEYLNKNKVA